MKTYSLGTPPSCAGLYYLTNKRTGQIYVGQSNGLRRRYNEWKNALSSGFGGTNVLIHDALQQSPDTDEWVFVVAKEMPGATTEELLAGETHEIMRLQALMPDKVLNTQAGKVAGPQAPVEDRLLIHTQGGSVVGQSVAARLLGRNVKTIADKSKWFKEKGLTEIKMEDLLLDRRDVLKKYQKE